MDFSIVQSCGGGEISDDLPPLPYLKTVMVSAVLLIDSDNRILLAQRPDGKSMAGLWEFPGGKIEQNETPEYALIRELSEELGIMTGIDCIQPLTFASHSYDDFHLLMPVFACRTWKGTPIAREGQTLKWVNKGDLNQYPMPAADIPLIPLIHQLV
jgi:8-oxo-dGTP diphosphatase